MKIKTIALSTVIALSITNDVAQGMLHRMLCFLATHLFETSDWFFSHYCLFLLLSRSILAMYRAALVGAAVARDRQRPRSDSDSMVSILLSVLIRGA
jgi:hypothetical protein